LGFTQFGFAIGAIGIIFRVAAICSAIPSDENAGKSNRRSQLVNLWEKKMSNAASVCLLIQPVQPPDAYKVSVPIPAGVSRTEKLIAIVELTNYLNQIPLLRMSIGPNLDQIQFVVDQQAMTYLPAIFDRVWELVGSWQ